MHFTCPCAQHATWWAHRDTNAEVEWKLGKHSLCVFIMQSEVWQRAFCLFGCGASTTTRLHVWAMQMGVTSHTRCSSEGQLSLQTCWLWIWQVHSHHAEPVVAAPLLFFLPPPPLLFLQSTSTLKNFHLADWPHQCYDSVLVVLFLLGFIFKRSDLFVSLINSLCYNIQLAPSLPIFQSAAAHRAHPYSLTALH